ncbi:AraC family transcriptional regulator [Psychrobacter sp. H8-1]|uniref:AraC family transcriptional regulator n=1 Tax=Psychrobacter sp. H8-1 TaxID=2774129 RepID=UPI0019193313|nr:AraC family transcriptional regulator [Psychrobacter sp. H8-1]
MDALSRLLQQSQHLKETKYYCLSFSGDWAFSLTSSDNIYFYLIQAGSFYITINEVSRQVYTGDIVMIPNSNKHVCHAPDYHSQHVQELDKTLLEGDKCPADPLKDSNSNTQFIVIECQYDKDLLRPLLSALPAILPEHDESHGSQFKALGWALGFLTIESQYERLGKLAMINLWASIVMVECLRTYIERLPEKAENWLFAMRDPYLSKTLAILHDSPDHKWTTHELAEKVGMSRSSFTQRFKNIMGVPPLTYLTTYRLCLAARQLRLQHNSIGQISELVGYTSNSTFSQAFKRVYGMSPKAYRERQQAAISN